MSAELQSATKLSCGSMSSAPSAMRLLWGSRHLHLVGNMCLVDGNYIFSMPILKLHAAEC